MHITIENNTVVVNLDESAPADSGWTSTAFGGFGNEMEVVNVY
jgi:hypothetical protein